MWPRAKKWILAISSIGFGVLMAFGTELIQYLTSSWSHRGGSAVDAAIDIVGFLLTAGIIILIFGIKSKKERNKSNSN